MRTGAAWKIGDAVGLTHFTVGILGCGHIAPTHVRAWKKDSRFSVRGVFDLNHELAQGLASRMAAGAVFDSSEQLISDSDVVDICTPPATHFPLIEAAIAERKHIVVEKPVVIDEGEWRRVLALLEHHDASFSVIHHLKFTRTVRTARRWLDEGRLGRLLRIENYFATHADVDRMLGSEPHWSHSLPGGRWFETLPHDLYLTHYLAGPLRFEGVTVARTERVPGGVDVDEIVISLAGPETLATIHFSANCRHNYRWAVLIGSKGVLRMDLLSGALAFDHVPDSRAARFAGRLFLNSLTALARAPLDRALYVRDRLARWTPHARFIEHLGEHLSAGSGPPTPMEEIQYTVEHCFTIGAAIEASRA